MLRGNPQNRADTDTLHCSSTLRLADGVHVHSFFHTVPSLLVSELKAWRLFARQQQEGHRLTDPDALVVGSPVLLKVPTVSGYGHANHTVAKVAQSLPGEVLFHCEHDSRFTQTSLSRSELHDLVVPLTPEVPLGCAAA